MTKEEFFTSGVYADFILIDNTVFQIPLGFKLSKNPQEKSNIVTVASGRKRYDIIKRWYSYAFEYEALTQAMMDSLENIVNAAAKNEKKIIYLKKSKAQNTADYETQPVDIIKSVKIKYKSRGKLTVYNGVTLEIE